MTIRYLCKRQRWTPRVAGTKRERKRATKTIYRRGIIVSRDNKTLISGHGNEVWAMHSSLFLSRMWDVGTESRKRKLGRSPSFPRKLSPLSLKNALHRSSLLLKFFSVQHWRLFLFRQKKKQHRQIFFIDIFFFFFFFNVSFAERWIMIYGSLEFNDSNKINYLKNIVLRMQSKKLYL